MVETLIIIEMSLKCWNWKVYFWDIWNATLEVVAPLLFNFKPSWRKNAGQFVKFRHFEIFLPFFTTIRGKIGLSSKDNILMRTISVWIPLVRHSGGAGVGMIGEGGAGQHGLDHLHHQHHHQQQQQRGHAAHGPQGGSRSVQGIELKLQNCFHCLLSFLLCPNETHVTGNTCVPKPKKTFCTITSESWTK